MDVKFDVKFEPIPVFNFHSLPTVNSCHDDGYEYSPTSTSTCCNSGTARVTAIKFRYSESWDSKDYRHTIIFIVWQEKCAAIENAPTKQWDQRNTYSFKYRKPYQDHSDSTWLRSMFWMKNKADKHVRGLEDMAPNPECFCFGHGQKNVKKIAGSDWNCRETSCACLDSSQHPASLFLKKSCHQYFPSLHHVTWGTHTLGTSMLCLWGCGSRGCISLPIVCLTCVWQSLLPLFCDKTFEFSIQTWPTC